MSRQERTARRVKRADKQAAAIIPQVRCKCGEVGTRVALKAAGHPRTCATTPAPPSPPQTGSVDLATECRRLRDGGMAWWLIGKTLGLPGAGDSASTGKAGAHQARRLYSTGGVPVPRVQAPRKGSTPKPTGPGRDGSKTDRKMLIVERGHVISPDVPDEEVVAMVAGHTIEWAIDINALCGGGGRPEWHNQEARVHPYDIIVDEELDVYGGRTIRFREYLGRDDSGRIFSGPTRTVRVNAIHTIR